MLSLKGKGVCGGVTLGTLAVLRRNAAAVKRRKVQNAEAEVARFQTARQDAIDKLAELSAEAIVAMVNGTEMPDLTPVPTRLISRKTC